MTTTLDIKHAQELLSFIKIRFSPKTQPLRETAIDKIVEQILFLDTTEEGLNFKNIEKNISITKGGHRQLLYARDIHNSLKRLQEKNRIMVNRERGGEFFTLSENARTEMQAVIEAANRNIKIVVAKLFDRDNSLYFEPFLRALSIIFSTLGELYAHIIKGESWDPDEIGLSRLIDVAIDKTLREYRSIIKEILKKGIVNFFAYRDPIFDEIRWTMAQHYFVLKMLGQERQSLFLTHDLLKGAVFYLDTNVVFSALEKEHDRHLSFQELVKACTRLGITLKVARLTIEELNHSISHKRKTLEMALTQIPDETAEKIDDIFYKKAYEQQKKGEDIDFDKVFSAFKSPVDDLHNLYGIDLEDDIWFDKAAEEPIVRSLVFDLIKRYKDTRGLLKSEISATNDAILIRWLQKKIAASKDEKLGFLTLDTSLPGIIDSEKRQLFLVTLDALLQWIFQFIQDTDDESSFALIFSEAIRHQILPRERFFGPEDFVMFAKMGMECRKMPARDVEQCIESVKRHLPNLNPYNPAELQKIAYEIDKFFSSPDREYVKEKLHLEKEIEDLKKDKNKMVNKSDLEEEKKRRIELESKLKILQDDYNDFKEKAKKFADEVENKKLGKSAIRRLLILFVIWFFIGIAIHLILRNYIGPIEKDIFFKFWGVWFFVCCVFNWFLLGEKRFKVLSWPLRKLFKGDR